MNTLPSKLSAGEALATKDAYLSESWWRWDAIIKGGGVSKNENPATCIAKAAYGELYGWDPILAVNRLYLIDGRPAMYAEAMLGLVRERCPDAIIIKAFHDATRCVVRAKRRPEDEHWHECEYTIDDAKTAGLLSKDNWKRHPKQMLWARTVSMLVRELFSDITMGCGTVEEMSEGPIVRQVGPQPATIDDHAGHPEDAEIVDPPLPRGAPTPMRFDDEVEAEVEADEAEWSAQQDDPPGEEHDPTDADAP